MILQNVLKRVFICVLISMPPSVNYQIGFSLKDCAKTARQLFDIVSISLMPKYCISWDFKASKTVMLCTEEWRSQPQPCDPLPENAIFCLAVIERYALREVFLPPSSYSHALPSMPRCMPSYDVNSATHKYFMIYDNFI